MILRQFEYFDYSGSGGLQVGRNRMVLNLSVKLFAQNDPVLAISRQQLLLGIAGIPDSSFRHEIESRAMNDHRPLRLRVRAEKDGRAEDSLERGDQAAVLRTALLHSEGAQHLGRAFKYDLRRLLPNRLRCQEDRNQAILSPRQPVGGMACDLKKEMPVPALMEQLSGPRPLYGQSAQYERSGSEPEVLIGLLSLHADTGDCIREP